MMAAILCPFYFSSLQQWLVDCVDNTGTITLSVVLDGVVLETSAAP